MSYFIYYFILKFLINICIAILNLIKDAAEFIIQFNDFHKHKIQKANSWIRYINDAKQYCAK